MSCTLLRPNAPRGRTAFKVLTEPKSKISGDKSFADDLSKQQGVVKSRVALLRRSSETKPFAVQICTSVHSFFFKIFLHFPLPWSPFVQLNFSQTCIKIHGKSGIPHLSASRRFPSVRFIRQHHPCNVDSVCVCVSGSFLLMKFQFPLPWSN